MNTENADEVARVMKAFAAEFPPDQVKLKPAMVKSNRCLALHYIDSRLVMDRLDDVVGGNNWRDEYTVLPGGSEVECRLSVRIAGEWITKADVGGQSEQPDEGDRMKAAYSDALKRAAVKFGIGRFLYRMPQQWMDYDPVKKQIIRPPAKSPPPKQPAAPPAGSRPAAENPKPAPAPAAKDNAPLRAKRTQELAQAATPAAVDAVGKAIADDWRAGMLSPADRDSLQGQFKDSMARVKAAAK